MSNPNYQMSGYSSPQLGGYAPADFLDAEETMPAEIYLDPTGNGSGTPYSTVISNVLTRNIQEIREAYPNPPIASQGWKKKFRDFLQNKNEDVLQFLVKKLPETSPINRVNAFMKKYGRTPDRFANNKDKFLDVSGEEKFHYLQVFEQRLQTVGRSNYMELMNQVKMIIDDYRETGDAIVKTEAALRFKLDNLDKVVQKLSGFQNLSQNTAFPALVDSVQSYLNLVFEENKIEEEYNQLLELYKKLHFLRDALQFLWSFEASQREPLCGICFNDPIQYALVPCGHTYCINCSKRQMMNCYICRTAVREKVKLYFD